MAEMLSSSIYPDVKNISTCGLPSSQIAQILPSFQAGKLENLDLYYCGKPTAEDMETIVNSDQWKNAKNISGFRGLSNIRIKDLLHFSLVCVDYATISVETAIEIKDVSLISLVSLNFTLILFQILLTSSNIKHAYFTSKSVLDVNVIRVFDPKAAKVHRKRNLSNLVRNTDFADFTFSSNQKVLRFKKKN